MKSFKAENKIGCLDDEATPLLDTVTLRPTPSNTVTIRPQTFTYWNNPTPQGSDGVCSIFLRFTSLKDNKN
jgi:hypothetical protein